MSSLRIVSWNINSIRLRADNVTAFIQQENPDVICLQEIKCRNEEFPSQAFESVGFDQLHVNGQRGGHYGVAIASKHPIQDISAPILCRENQSRTIAATISGIEIHNIYLPAGGDAPDPELNEKFAHKLDFIEKLGNAYKTNRRKPLVLVGDLNVAPHENDVWSHKQLLKIVSHTPVETEGLRKAISQGNFTDIARMAYPDDQKLYTWWSYRAKDWAASNRGRRLDHIWANPAALKKIDVSSFRIHLKWRGGWKPSDHAPISVSIRTD